MKWWRTPVSDRPVLPLAFWGFAILAFTILAPTWLTGCSGSSAHRPAQPDAGPARDGDASRTKDPNTTDVRGEILGSGDLDRSGRNDGIARIDAAGNDSSQTDADWLIDSLAVPVDSLNLPGAFQVDLPDISDSLAAATEAQLPSVDEIFDYPIEFNRRVLAWIDFYLGRGRRSFDHSLERSGRYLAMARRIFAEEGVPQDLASLAHVESGFRHNAQSPARALGLWQFMRGTARCYGLRCDAYVDERLDPEKSTRACAQHLRDLYAEYGDWYLSLAAYNAGAGKVNRAIRKTGEHNFWDIARTRYLVNETRNFVPAILAATILAKSPGAYGFKEATEPPLEYDTITVDTPTDLRVLSAAAGIPLAELVDLNPALLLMQTPRGEPYAVHVPAGFGEAVAAAIEEIPPEKRLVHHRHVVRSGQTLGGLAHRYGTTVGAIQDANGMGRRTTIYAGDTLLIPSRHGGLGDLALAGPDGTIKHTVRRGECLSNIAAHYRVKVGAISSANGLADPRRIYPGQVLAIPLPPDRLLTQLAERDPVGLGSGGALPVRAQNNSDSLGRVASTAHIVEQAREAIKLEEARAAEENRRLPGPTLHTVRRGDTLSEIATRYDVRVSELRRWNGLGRSSLIYPGRDLRVAPPDGNPSGESRVHVVQRGESLWTIAQRYGVRVSDLTQWNDISRGSIIRPGQKLLLY